MYYNARANYLDPKDPRAWHPVADRETGALRRIAKICSDAGLIYYHQHDPRGCALYIGRADMLDGVSIESNYTRLIAIC